MPLTGRNWPVTAPRTITVLMVMYEA